MPRRRFLPFFDVYFLRRLYARAIRLIFVDYARCYFFADIMLPTPDTSRVDGRR